VLFKSASGAGADASIEAFDDSWTWGASSKHALLDIEAGTNRALTVMMQDMHSAIGENPLMAYLAMMAVRLVELHRRDGHRKVTVVDSQNVPVIC
jgi:site-specific DNA-methyltransferase (adenine-specific)